MTRPTTLAVVADSHVPDREQRVPERFRDRLRAADHVVHAGDLTAAEFLADLRDLATELTAVAGNVDPDELGLPDVATVAAGGVTLVVTHGDGPGVRTRADWLDHVTAVAREHADPPLVAVGGHSHHVEDTVHDGVRALNPGTVTGADPVDRATMLTVEAAEGDLGVELHEA